jgi:hypothetical protein
MKRARYSVPVLLALIAVSACGGDAVTLPTGAGSSGSTGSDTGSGGEGGAASAGQGGAGQGGAGQGGAAQGGAGQGGAAQGGAGQGGAGGGGNLPAPGDNGSACLSDQDCTSGACLTEPGNGWPSGYCTELCDLMVGACAFGGVCLDVQIGGGQGACFDTCSLQAMDCRDAYECINVGNGNAACVANCTSNPQCTITNLCDVMTGFCDTPPGMTPTGMPCTQSFECLSNNDDPYCITEADEGWPSGYCSEVCDLANNDCAGDAVCLDVNLPNNQGLCFDGCTMDADCPTPGYVCSPAGPGVNVCTPVPPPESVCDNFIDDDGDGLQDCLDPDCQATPICQPGMTPTGMPCTANNECAANANDPLCLDEAMYGWPSGYCTEYCDLMNDDCAGDAVCFDVGLQSGAGLCLDGCNNAASCQTPGYQCLTIAPMTKACTPECTADNQCQAFCNPDEGLCNAAQETCGDGLDNDDDNAVDCEDLTCAAGCQASIDMACAGAAAAQASNMGNTTGGTSILAGCTGSGAPERIYTYMAPQNGTLTLALSSASDLGLYVRLACNDKTTQIACTDLAGPGGTEQIVMPAQAGVPLTIVVDGALPGVMGAYTLTVTLM